jgi:hypothetical protein
MLTDQWQTNDVDLTSYIRTPGQYEVELRQTSAQGELDVRDAVAVIAGTEAPRLITELNRPQAWNINRTDQVADDLNGRTALRLAVRTKGNNPWKGGLYIRGGE